jgi:dTDP-4-amino-4,6-dideoxygalactose transaminase
MVAAAAAGRIPFQAPEPPDPGEIAKHYQAAEQSGWFSNFGPCERELRERLSAFLGLEHPAVTVGNATLGLILAATAAFDPGRGDLVAMPSFTFVATATAIRYAGFRPLLVDVDPDTWRIAPETLRQLGEQPGVAGVMPCSTFGTAPTSEAAAAEDEALAAVDLPAVHDSAAGFGAADEQGRLIGGRGRAEVFSFHATKPFAIGEGGAITSRDPELLERLRRLSNFGFDDQRRVDEPGGLNAKLAELPAATALAVLDRFPGILEHRRAMAGRLIARLAAAGIRGQDLPGPAGSTWQFVPVLMPDPASRQRVTELAARRAIEVRTYFDPPLHRWPIFADVPRLGDLAGTEELSSRIVSLPMSNRITVEEIDRVADLCLDAL